MPPSTASRPALDDLLLFRFGQVGSVAGSLVIRLCEGRFGITRREWRLLAKLASVGALSPSALAAQAHLDRARTSKAVSSMVAKGLVHRAVQGADRRQASLSLTSSGFAIYDELYPLVKAINEELLDSLDEAARASLDTALARLQRRAVEMSEAAQDRLPRAGRGRRRSDPTGTATAAAPLERPSGGDAC